MAKKRPHREMFSIFLVLLILFVIAATNPPDGRDPPNNPPAQENLPGKTKNQEDFEAALLSLPGGLMLPKGKSKQLPQQNPDPEDDDSNEHQQPPQRNPENDNQPGNLPTLPIIAPGGRPPIFPDLNSEHNEPLFPENFDALKPDQCYESCYKNESVVEGKTVGDGKENCHQHCPLPVPEADMESWLEQIWFKKMATGNDGEEECGQKNDLTFIFCPQKGKDPQNCVRTIENQNRIYICFQSKLDPENGLVEQILEVPNSDTLLDKICNQKMENGPKMHGFSVEFNDEDEDGKFIVEISFSDETFEYNVGKGNCLALEMFGSLVLDGGQQFLSQTYALRMMDSKSVPIQSQMNEMEENGKKLNEERPKKSDDEEEEEDKEEKMEKPKLAGLSNGVALNFECYKGPWLLGMDMLLQFEDGPLYIKTYLENEAKYKCHPQVSYMSSEIVPIKKCKNEEQLEGMLGCKIDKNVWEKAKPGNKMPSDRVKLDQDGTVVEFKEPSNNNKLLELTFAVPNPHKFNFNVAMKNENICKGEFQRFIFNFNKNEADCQLGFGRKDTDISVLLVAKNITGKLNPNGGAVKVGTNYDIEIDKNVVQKKNDIEHPLFVLPQNCAVQNERVQDFGRVIGSSNKFVMKFILVPVPDSRSEPTLCDKSMFTLKFPKEYDLLVKKKDQK